MTRDDKTLPANLESIRDAVLDVWPEHGGFLIKSLQPADKDGLKHADEVAGMVLSLAGETLKDIVRDYRWTCERLLEEELHFQRHGDYRIKSFAEAKRAVYDNPDFMGRYINGLMLSHLLWSNHRSVLRYFSEQYLPAISASFNHLEVGPGHGLYLYLAAIQSGCNAAVGWDISATSVENSRQCLKRLGAPQTVSVEQQDILSLDDVGTLYDSVVISEVLEHLEDPHSALISLKRVMKKDGCIFINVPINSPAPDHIYLLNTPEEAFDLVENCGFKIADKACFAATGYSEQRARKLKATISCVIIATPE